MAHSFNKIKVYLEIGSKRTVAGAIDWPGWCRIGRDEASAIQALLDYAPRYARVVRAASLGFRAPLDAKDLTVIERLAGNMTTDFGAPAIAPADDVQPVNPAELERLKRVLKACWHTFDKAVTAAVGQELVKGPRGGGRDLDKIVAHVLGADEAYVAQLGVKIKWTADDATGRARGQTWLAIQNALAASARGELPKRGPRGGLRWTPRYFCRRAAWHILDHAWEIEDRVRD
jgi:hypothetical protein